MNFEELILELFNYNKVNFSLILTLLALLFITIYFVIILWVIVDINKRTNNFFTKVIAVLVVVFFSIPGLIGYLLLRPHQTLKEREESKLYNKKDILLIEPDLKYCSHCLSLNKKEYKYCTTCGTDLNFECPNCYANADTTWSFCPYCKYGIHPKMNGNKKKRPKSNVLGPLTRVTSSILYPPKHGKAKKGETNQKKSNSTKNKNVTSKVKSKKNPSSLKKK